MLSICLERSGRTSAMRDTGKNIQLCTDIMTWTYVARVLHCQGESRRRLFSFVPLVPALLFPYRIQVGDLDPYCLR
jgi:hypothetical protein